MTLHNFIQQDLMSRAEKTSAVHGSDTLIAQNEVARRASPALRAALKKPLSNEVLNIRQPAITGPCAYQIIRRFADKEVTSNAPKKIKTRAWVRLFCRT